MTDTIFKTATSSIPSDAVSTAKEDSARPDTNIIVNTTKLSSNPTLDQVREEMDGAPYASKFFNVNTEFKYLPSKVQGKLTAIDKFVESEIAENGWKANASNYERALSNIALELGADEENLLDEIERVGSFAENMLKLNGVDEIRKQLRSKLRRMQNGKDMSNAVLKAIGKKIL